MSKKIRLGKQIISEMHNFLDKEKCAGRIAQARDMYFMADGSWLKDAAVIDIIKTRDGAWDVTLVFAHYKNPLLLLVRTITRCFSEQKAQAAAFYLRKEAAKDRRGTLYVSIADLNLCGN